MGKILYSKECFKICPICGNERLPDDEQPEHGTHAFTEKFVCGTTIDYPLGYPECHINQKCEDEEF